MDQKNHKYLTCKRCNNKNIRIVNDMRLKWVECDRCSTTYIIDI